MVTQKICEPGLPGFEFRARGQLFSSIIDLRHHIEDTCTAKSDITVTADEQFYSDETLTAEDTLTADETLSSGEIEC